MPWALWVAQQQFSVAKCYYMALRTISRIASKVSRRVPSISSSRASTRTSLLRLFVQLPQRISDVVDRGHRLPLLRSHHLGPRHQGLADRQGTQVSLVPDPDEVAGADRGVRIDDAGGHDVRTVIDELHGPHVHSDPAPFRGGCEEAPDGEEGTPPDDNPADLVVCDQEPPLLRLREVDVVAVAERVHAKGIRDRLRVAVDFLATEPLSPTNPHLGGGDAQGGR